MIASIDDAEINYGFYDTGNSDTFLDFVKSQHRKHCKIFILLYNTKYHSVQVKGYIQKMNAQVVFMYLPKYTPALNAAKPQWKHLKNATKYVFCEYKLVD